MRLPWKYILVSFTVGLLLGGSVGLYYAHDLARQWMRKGPEAFLRRLDHALHLTDPQRAEIRTLLNTNHEKIAAYQDAVRKTTRAQIRTHLSTDQVVRFDAMVAKHDADRRKRGGK